MNACQDEVAILQKPILWCLHPQVFHTHYLQGPGWSLCQAEPSENYKNFLCCVLKMSVASAMCCLLFPFLSPSQLLQQRSGALSHPQERENMIMRREMRAPSWTLISSTFSGDRCWNEFCANGNSWTTGVKIKCLAEGNYHMVKVPDFGSGALLKTFVWFVARHLIFCTSPIKCG